MRRFSADDRAWAVLSAGGLLEVIWAAALRRAHGFDDVGWLAAGLALSLVSVAMLAWAMRRLPLGTAYAAWIGIGTVGTVAVGIAVFGEPASALRLLCVACIVVAIAGLRATSRATTE